MAKRIHLLPIVFSVTLIIIISLVGCSSQPARSNTTTSGNQNSPITSTTGPGASQVQSQPSDSKVYKLTFSYHEPADSWATTHALSPWARKIEEATNGRIQITDYPAQTLAKGTDQWQAVKTGVTDIGWCFHGYWPGMTPLSDVMSLPFLQFKSAEQASAIFWNTYEKFPQVQEEYSECKIITLFTSDPYFLITANKQVKTKEDLSGLKLRIPGGPPSEAMKYLGTSPMLVPMTDIYLMLQKGVIDGAAMNWMAIDGFRFYELTKYYTYVPLFVVYFSMAMNWDVWNSFSPEIQKQIEEAAGGLEAAKFMGKNFFDTATENLPATVKKAGYPVNEYTLPADELNRWIEVSNPVVKSWINSLPADKPGQEVLDYIYSQIQSTQ